MKRLILIISLLLGGLAFANPPGTYQPLLIGPPNPTLTFLQATSDSSNLTTYTFVGQNFGPADGSRQIAAAYCWAGGGGDVSSSSIGGVTGTQSVTRAQTGTSGGCGISIAAVPTGASGTVSVTLTAGATRFGLSLYAITNLNSPTATATTTVTSSTAGVVSGSTNVSANGVIIGAFYCVDDLTGVTWTGITTKDADVVIEAANEFSTASRTAISALTPLSWTAVDGTTSIRSIGIAAAYR